MEMPSVAVTMENNDMDGRMLLDECAENDIEALVVFPPLQRKLIRSINSLREQADGAASAKGDAPEVSDEIQRSLDQLNETMRELAQAIALESATSSCKPAPTVVHKACEIPVQPSSKKNESTGPKGEEHETIEEAVGQEQAGEQAHESMGTNEGGHRMPEEEAAVKIQARTRGMIARKAQVSQRTAEENKLAGEQAHESMGTNEGGHRMPEEEAAVKIQARTRGMIARKAQVSNKTAEENELAGEQAHESMGTNEGGHRMPEEEAAVKIQARTRGMIARKAQVSNKTAEEGVTF
jgi:flagellar hook assembly protein FlgD